MRINLGIEAKAGIRPCKGCSKMPAARVVVTDNPNNTATFGIACNNCYIGTNGYVWSDVVRAWNQSYCFLGLLYCTAENGTPRKAKPPSNEQVMDQRIAELEEANSNLLHQCRAKDDTIAMLEHAIKGMKSEETKWKDEYECLLNAINLIVERENRRNGD